MKELIKNHIRGVKGFAEEYGIPYNTVCQWANGSRKPPEWLTKLFYSMKSKTNEKQIKIDNPIKRKYFACIYHPKSDTIIRTSLLRKDDEKECYLINWGKL